MCFTAAAQVLNPQKSSEGAYLFALQDSVCAMNVLGFGRRSTKGVDALDLTRHGGYNPGPIPVVEASPRPPVTRISMADSAVPLLRGGAESHPLWDAGVPKHDAQSLRSLRAPGEDPTPTSIMAEIDELKKLNKAAGGRSSPAPAPPDIESAIIGRV
jgi:hypothetical protein